MIINAHHGQTSEIKEREEGDMGRRKMYCRGSEGCGWVHLRREKGKYPGVSDWLAVGQ
jgi:hypothetical protein